MDDSVRKVFDERMGDARLVGITWQGTNLSIRFESASVDDLFELTFEWYHGLRVELSFGSLVDRPLIWDATVSPEGSGWNVHIDFGGTPDGEICFFCQNITLNEAP